MLRTARLGAVAVDGSSGGPVVDWRLGVALAILLGLAVAVGRVGRLELERPIVTAAARAMVQLAVVALVIAAVLERWWASSLFAGLMFATATFTAAGRIGARRNAPWIGLALLCGVAPTLMTIFAIGAATFTGQAIIPIAGIVIGGSMTAHTLTARRAFDALRSDRGQVEAGLALGLHRSAAITIVIARHAPEALTPVLDQTRTVGLVTLPGTFVGVLLGGGSVRDAAAAQVLVLVRLLAAETCVVVATQRLIADGRILPADLREVLPAH